MTFHRYVNSAKYTSYKTVYAANDEITVGTTSYPCTCSLSVELPANTAPHRVSSFQFVLPVLQVSHLFQVQA